MMVQINHNDMLEMGRKFTPSRNEFTHIHGILYKNKEPIKTFNKPFSMLSEKETNRYISLPKIIYKENIYGYQYPERERKPNSMWQYLRGLLESKLDNPAYIAILQDMVTDHLLTNESYAFYLFYGTYDVPEKQKDLFITTAYYEPEIIETFPFIIGSLCPINEHQLPKAPVSGFMYPSFIHRESDHNTVTLVDHKKHLQMKEVFLP